MSPQLQPVIRRILRADRPSSPGEYLLVRLDPTPRTSSDNPLNLKIVATDQEHLYHGSLRTSEISSLQAKSFRGNLNEWSNILRHVLLQERPIHLDDEGKDDEDPLPTFLQDIEIVAGISSASVTLTIRQNVQGVTQRLGELVLIEDDEREEVAAFEWVDVAVHAADELRRTRDEERARTVQERRRMEDLERQLDELVRAKKAHEEVLVGKFAALLNAKKSKIRMLQRLLKGEGRDDERDGAREQDEGEKADVDVTGRRGGRLARGNAKPGRQRQVGTSRGGKRKAKEPPPVEEEDEDETMVDIGVTPVGNAEEDDEDEDADERLAATPEPSDDETEDELDLPSRPKHPSNPIGEEDRTIASIEQSKEDVGESSQGRNNKAPPPRRELPFTRKAPSATTRSSRSTELPSAAAKDEDLGVQQGKLHHHDGTHNDNDDTDEETEDEL